LQDRRRARRLDGYDLLHVLLMLVRHVAARHGARPARARPVR
jgi:hypothetical protein